MSSLKSVAEKAGVSLMTVSRALNHPEQLSKDTLERVQNAIQALNYIPNASAKMMRNSGKKSIGVLSLNAATTPFSVDILLGIEQTVRQHQWHSFVINSFENEEEMNQAADYLLSYHPAGIIIARNGLEKIHIPAKLHKTPLVLANCLTDDIEVASYIPNDYQGQFDLTHHLVQKGYKRPLCLYIPQTALAAPIRQQGFLDAWQTNPNAEPAQQFFMQGSPHTYEHGADELAKILAQGTKPFPFDVIVCGNDRIAFLAYQMLLAHGLRIPQDVAVVGFDNMVGITHLFRPPLTTVELPHYKMGQQAALHFIKNRQQPQNHHLSCPIILGESC